MRLFPLLPVVIFITIINSVRVQPIFERVVLNGIIRLFPLFPFLIFLVTVNTVSVLSIRERV